MHVNPRLASFVAAAGLALGAAPAWATFTPPVVSFSFLSSPPTDADPSPYVTNATGTLLAGGGARQYSGKATADLRDGTLKVAYDERYAGPLGNPPVSLSGHASVARFFDTVTAGSNGWIALTLSGHGLLSHSSGVIGSWTDQSWAGWGFAVTGQVFNPGSGGLVGGGGLADGAVDFDTNDAAPVGVARSVGVAGNRKAVIVDYAADPTGALITLTAYVNAGDRVNFSATAAGRGWADSHPGAFAQADLLNTATLSISASPGMAWTSESGVLLSAVPEPAGWALLLPGLALAAAATRCRPTAGTDQRA